MNIESYSSWLWFCFILSDWTRKNWATFFKKSDSKSEIGSLVFSQLQAMYLLCLEFSFAPCDIFLGSDWLLWYLWFWFCDITWNDLWLLILCARNPVVFFEVQWNQQCMKITSWPMEISITIDKYEKWDRENNVPYLFSYKMHSVITCA